MYICSFILFCTTISFIYIGVTNCKKKVKIYDEDLITAYEDYLKINNILHKSGVTQDNENVDILYKNFINRKKLNSEINKKIQKCSEINKKIQKCSEINKKIQKCSEINKKIQ
jgi:hypothetical protein